MNNSTRQQPALGFGEFVALMAMITSLAALSTDAMLPALSEIGAELGVVRDNDNQLIVSLLFLGLAVGQILYGPVSDSSGRKPAIYAGYAIFLIGCVLSILATSFPIMLAGRILQGLGIAGPRSVTMALIRDKFEGREMARVMSFIMMVFIFVPIIAPTFGQAILLVAHWRAIFAALLAMALGTALWFALRQPETLPATARVPFSMARVFRAIRQVLTHRVSLGYTVAAGLISGSFLAYLSSAQQIFQIQYGLGTRFPLMFATIALALGTASFTNGRLVMRYGMRTLSNWAVRGLSVLSISFLVVALLTGGHPPLWALITYCLPAFGCVGILFGNLNSLAMEPLGRIAGVGAAVVGSLSTLIGVFLSSFIGQSYNGTVIPLVAGFAILSTLGLLVMYWVQRETPVPSAAAS